ncbi:cupin-like domain-containing protein [Corallococcus sicarius]|uniref:Transcriptional regulator n=1 Tax=Corallococcus sicarius TaxID=2316726 RepID=A0A3A8NR48_9BACT|nr:cupin-like domain-containing protein [Corallococcus sicarius]RKH46827.1 transcriptional regulator [Corallococcus sicarius]
MSPKRIFESVGPSPLAFDRQSFRCRHTLLGHPALELENLAGVVQRLPADNVFFSSGLLPKDADFDRAHVDYRTGLSLKDTVENMMTSNSYIMLRAPEQDPSFQGLFRMLLAEVEDLMRAQGVGTTAVDPMLYLFIASPGSVTPFHLDRYSTLLMQFRGTKEVHVSPAWDEQVVPAADLESFVVRSGSKVNYRETFDTTATRYAFGPGDALHIPFVAPHYVKNGSDDVSVSLSIIFNTRETARHLRALRTNHLLRSRLGPLGYQPTPVNRFLPLDHVKSNVERVVRRARRLLPV